MADAALSIVTPPVPTTIVPDAGATAAAATVAGEATADPFASLLATLTGSAAPPVTAATPGAVFPAPATAVPAPVIAEVEGEAPDLPDPAGTDSDDGTPADADPLATAIAAGPTAVLAMAQALPVQPATVTAPAQATPPARPRPSSPAAEAPLAARDDAPEAPAPQTTVPQTATSQAGASKAGAPAPQDAAAIVQMLQAAPASSDTDTDTEAASAPRPAQAPEAAPAAAPVPPRTDRAPQPIATHQPAPATADKPAHAAVRRVEEADFVPTGPIHAASREAALPVAGGRMDAPAPATAPDGIVQQQLAIAADGQWLDTLARDIARAAGSGNALHFKLDPQHLGALTVSIAQGDDGAAIRMTADSDTTRTILIDAQPRLVAEARAQGLRISETHVDLSQQNGGGSRGSDMGGGQMNAQANGHGQQPAPDRQPFIRTPGAARAEDAGTRTETDELYA